MHHAEDNKLSNEGWHGGRPGQTAHDPVLTKELINEWSHLTRKPNVKFTNDAASCCDRTSASLGSIVSRKFRMPESACLVMPNTLEGARHKLKTELGALSKCHKHSEEHLICSIGQGSRNGPALWTFTSSVLFDCHDSAAHGAAFASFDQKHKL